MANRCFLCKSEAESCNHILLWCPFSYGLWSSIYGLLGINWVMAGMVKSELIACEGLCKKNTLSPYTFIYFVGHLEREK